MSDEPEKRGGMLIWFLVAAVILLLAVLALAWQRGGPQPLREIDQPVIFREGKSA